jgi:predicted nucleotidyltransferase
MPVRSLHSSVLRWPSVREVRDALGRWAAQEAPRHPGLLKLGYFGSYARGDAGVGSDVDLVAVVRESTEPFERRGLAWDLLTLPVPAEILVYTRSEWERLRREGGRFAQVLERETVWLVGGPGGRPGPSPA